MSGDWPWGDLKPGHYRFIYVDLPTPWSGGKEGRPQHYKRMTPDEILALPIHLLAHPEGGRIGFWTTAPLAHHRRLAPVFVMQAWARPGFRPRYSTKSPWLKTWEKEGDRPLFVYRDSWARGTGLVVVGNHEDLTIWNWGKAPPLFDTKEGKRVRRAPALDPVFVESRRQHSRKPDAVRDAICARYPGPRCELFSRSDHPGFDHFGDELGKFGRAA